MKIVFKTTFGSHLYGTNTKDSDTDFKAVFMASMEEIILKEDRSTIQENTKSGNTHGVRNSKDDIDCEYIELRKFIKDAQDGQTYALDMLFAPESFWVESSPIWRDIISNRKKLLSKDVKPMLGYCRSQAGKYGLKGSRLGELTRVIDHLIRFDPKDRVIDCIEDLELTEFVKRYEAISKRQHGLEPIKEEFIDVLGKKFQMNRFVSEVLYSLEKMRAMYGDRAKMAMENNGVDWKAISHAFRCCYQLQELAANGEIKFPLVFREYLKKVKSGSIPYSELGDKLYAQMEKSKAAIENSTLPEKTDSDFWRNFIIKTYL